MEDKVLCLFLPLSSVGTGPNLLNNNFFPLSIQLFAANPFGVFPPNSDIIGGKPPDLQIAVGLKQATERATWKSPIFFSNCQALKGLQSIKSQGENYGSNKRLENHDCRPNSLCYRMANLGNQRSSIASMV